MDYDYRNRSGSTYESPMYRTSSTSSAPSNHPMYGGGGGSSLYPRVGQPGPNMIPPPTRTSSHHQHHHSSPSSGLGIRVAIKPQYRITPPPQLSTQIGDIPRSNFQFDFEFERKILAEAEKDSQNWSRFGLENLPSRNTESTSSMQRPVGDPVVNKYITMGLNREAVPLAVANYGDNPTKVQEFVKGYGLLREMGFSSSNVAEALVMFDNDTDKAIAHFLNSST
ncbi:uncharacterized protein LOC112020209 isoform X1 [Quercus suber]|uniref:UBA domain-containing protein n=1 Tax=Quercus suber TaxID=58331 RepID=A0AAW0JMV1_QUESU|nr:uncharacterized protein LOC112020209 isoform X1 [Quercus suber]POF15696.1 hypothetical protein CFP56_35334 [Quercus suber]